METTTKTQTDQKHIKNAALRLRALNHPLRRKIMSMLDNKMTVTEIWIKLRVEQSVVSQQIGILKKAGFLNAERNGKYISYSVNQIEVDRVNILALTMASSIN
jgi:DNA-binding transcriptional ArsR family regulator